MLKIWLKGIIVYFKGKLVSDLAIASFNIRERIEGMYQCVEAQDLLLVANVVFKVNRFHLSNNGMN